MFFVKSISQTKLRKLSVCLSDRRDKNRHTRVCDEQWCNNDVDRIEQSECDERRRANHRSRRGVECAGACAAWCARVCCSRRGIADRRCVMASFSSKST